MNNIPLKELSVAETNDIQGGQSSWESIGYSVGKGLGWFYNNVMIGTPWP